MQLHFNRRYVLHGLAGIGAAAVLGGWTKSRELPFGSDVGGMKPGDYTWAPERSSDGPLALIVSLPEQRAYTYRAGELIGVTTCSTGRKGHRTPTGVFTVLQMDQDHVSSTYKGAKMPFMERLTWSGIALHAGNLPGYPASHGCIRLPFDFARKLFGISHLGVAVIIADGHSEPAEVVHPGMFLPAPAIDEIRSVTKQVAQKTLPPKRRHMAGHRPAKVVISVADKSIQIFEDGHLRQTGPLTIQNPDQPIGDHMFVLKSAYDSGESLVWTAVSYRFGTGGRLPTTEARVIDRLTTNPETAHAIQRLMHPGLTMVITDSPAPRETRTARNFAIMTHHDPADWKTQVLKN